MSTPPTNQPTFEQALIELEKLVRDLEEGQVGLEESLARYEKGVGLLKFCYGQLQNAGQRIQLLAGMDDDGKPSIRPFEHASASEEKPDARARKKADQPLF